jgi:aryl-alcohol dehydrogenase-like predicted oxidoreductase
MKISLGTAQLGLPYGVANRVGQLTGDAARDVVALARARGVDTLDTAVAYGDSEACLGRIGVEGFRVVTKLPPLPSGRDVARWVRETVNGSLSRLRVSNLYGLLLHRPEDVLGNDGRELAQALLALKGEGIVAKLGISIYGPGSLPALAEALPLDLVQAPFNVLDRRLATSGWLARLKSAGAEVHVRSIFLQGLLTIPPSDIPPRLAAHRAHLERWHAWLREEGVSPIAACVAFAAARPEIDRIVVGATSVDELREVLDLYDRGAAAPLPPDALATDDERLVNPSLWNVS